MSRLPALILASLCACAGDTTMGSDDGTPDDGTPSDGKPDEGTPDEGGGETYWYLLNYMDVPTPDAANRVEGFNLDGRASTGSEADSCGHPDFEGGVDNQLGIIAEQLASTVNVTESFAEPIANGEMAIVLEVSGVNDTVNDSKVEITAHVAELSDGGEMPVLGADGRPAPGATYDYRPVGSGTGSITGGTLTANLGTLQINVEAGAGEPPWELSLLQTRLEATFAEDALIDGVLGATTPVEEVIAMVERSFPEYASLARTVLTSYADFGASCDHISLALLLEGVSAVPGTMMN